MEETQAAWAPQWAIVEVMGHQTFAGMVSEQTVFGMVMCRVDVPEVEAGAGRYGADMPAQSAFTKLIGGGSIYALTPVTEEVARAAARSNSRPVSVYIPPVNSMPAARLAQIAGSQATVCICGHPAEDHDGVGGWCVAHECQCEGYMPPESVGEEPHRISTTCTCGHAEVEHDPDDQFCTAEGCDCMNYDRDIAIVEE